MQFFETTHANQRITLYNQDCITGMKRQAAGSVNVIVTSPPYNLGIAYGTYDDSKPRKSYLRWTKRWARAAAHFLAADGSLFLNIGGKPKDPWGPLEVAFQLRECGFELQNVIHWIKSIAIEELPTRLNGSQGTEPQFFTRGHYKPINSQRFLNDCHEYIFHFTKSGAVALDRLAIGVPYQDKSNIARWGAIADKRCRGNTWFIPYETINSFDDRPHPASFPVQLPEMCLRLHGLERVRRCADPFLGIGTSALAAMHLSKAFVGFDIDDGYLQIARERIESESAIQPEAPLPDTYRE